jgi:hypothetical protein
MGLAPATMRMATVAGGEPVTGSMIDMVVAGRPGRDDGSEGWLERRDFLAAVAGISLGSSMEGPAGAGRLASQVPMVVDRSPRRVALGDVQHVEATTAAFRDWDNLFGGGLSRGAVVAQLRGVVRMHEASVTPDVRTALHRATADLGSLAAWMTYDVEDHHAARPLWMLALRSAKQADDTELLAEVLGNLAHQSLHLGRPDEALRLVKIARTAVEDADAPPSPSVHCMLAAMQAWCHAAVGRLQPCLHAIGEAEALFIDVDPTTAPPWLRYFDEAELAALTGHSYHLLAGYHPNTAELAAVRLQAAVNGFDSQYIRSKALNLTGLAATHFRRGDIDAAVGAGDEALDLVPQLTSSRTYTRLHGLQAAADSYAGEALVAGFLDRMRGVLATT